MHLRTLTLILVALLSLRPAPAQACSLTADTIIPTNFELVQLADAIVVANAHTQYRTREQRGVSFRVDSVLKGPRSQRFRLEEARIGTVGRSNLIDLSAPHDESGHGMCNRYTFERGGQYLLFLERGEDGVWRELGHPYSRVNEDYAGEANPWMRSVRRYLRLQRTLGPIEQIAALRAMAQTGRDTDGRRLGRTERRDIADHLAALTPWKPTEMLVDAYERVERGEPNPFSIPAGTGWGGEADADIPLTMIGATPPRHTGAAGERLLLLDMLARGRHPAARPLFDRLTATSPSPAVRGLALRYFAANGHYPRAYRWIEQHLLDELPRLERADAGELLLAVSGAQRGDWYDGGRPRWLTDPHSAATWPALARRIDAYQTQTFGADRVVRLTPDERETRGSWEDPQ